MLYMFFEVLVVIGKTALIYNFRNYYFLRLFRLFVLFFVKDYSLIQPIVTIIKLTVMFPSLSIFYEFFRSILKVFDLKFDCLYFSLNVIFLFLIFILKTNLFRLIFMLYPESSIYMFKSFLDICLRQRNFQNMQFRETSQLNFLFLKILIVNDSR